MTRENAIMELKIFSGTTRIRFSANFWEALNTAIKALEQEGYYKCLAQSYEKTIVKLTEAIAEQQPSDDCVSRQVAIDYLYTNMAWYDENGSIADDSQKLRDITNLVNGIPSVTPTQRWIPCSERLPEEDKDYLLFGKVVEDEENNIFIGEYDSCGEQFGVWIEQFDRTTLGCLGSEFYEYASVLAWMPLPEPYKAERRE